MKNTMILSLFALSVTFASCGGGNDMEADAKTLCDCFKDMNNKPEDCKVKFDAMKENYSKEDSKKLWEKATLECK